MGGASRNDKRRRQEAAGQRLAAAGIRPPRDAPNRTPLFIVLGVLAVAVAAAGAVWFVNRPTDAPVTPTYAAALTGAVVSAGNGPVAIDVYEDYLCPQCERFEQRYGDELTTALNNGQITVRYHAIAILNPLTTPPGYSTRSANAALCSVSAGVFPAYHKKLFENQPAEGSAGLTDDQLIELGSEVGAAGNFAGCVRGAVSVPVIAGETERVVADSSLQTNGQFGTPTVAINGTKINLNDGTWLSSAIAAG